MTWKERKGKKECRNEECGNKRWEMGNTEWRLGTEDVNWGTREGVYIRVLERVHYARGLCFHIIFEEHQIKSCRDGRTSTLPSNIIL